MELGTVIKQFREARGWSQGRLAEALGYKDRSAVAQIERGGIDLPRSKLRALARELNIPASVLLGEDLIDNVSPDDALLDAAHRAGYLYSKASVRDQQLIDTILAPYDEGAVSPL